MTGLVRHPSELKPQFLSNNSFDPWVDVNSGPRKVMFSGHLPQALVIHGSEERYWQTGAEARFGEYCFSVKAPCDMEVLRIIDRFPKSRTLNTTIRNPQRIIIYIDVNTRQIGCMDMRDFSLEHQYFGFNFKKTEAYKRLTKGACFAKDTEFLVSPSIKDGGGYGYGINAMFANMSHPAVSEDGILISESLLKRMSFDMVETRTSSWGSNRYAINLFGDEKHCKIFKDVGELIRPDGLLMATREYDDRLAVTSMGVYDTMMLDMMYDEKLYTRSGNGRVVDIMVYHDNRSLPNGMNDQVMYYKDLTDNFYREILDEYNIQARHRKGSTNWQTDEFHQLVLEACAMTDYPIDEVVQKLYHKAPIDDWRVEFKIHYTIVPNVGNKLTGTHGNKGVVCTVLPDEEMPVNEHGVRTEMVMSPESPFNRQDEGLLYESYFNQVTREFLVTVRDTIQIGPEEEPTEKQIQEDMQANPDRYNHVWDRLIRLYDILSPAMYDNYSSPKFDHPHMRALHLYWLLKSQCIHILSPTDNMTAWRHAVNACEKEFKPRVTPLRYRDYSGNWVWTQEAIDIGHMYVMVLEKISDDWIAVSTAKTQHLELLGQVTSSDKYANPAKTQAVKAFSEAEVRITMSYCGGEVAADILDRNNSLATHREYVYSILDSATPTNIERGVDRKVVPLGNNRALTLFKHILQCNGSQFKFEDYQDPDISRRDQFVDKSREELFGYVREPMGVRKEPKKSIYASLREGAKQLGRRLRNLFNRQA